jgi:hypothetical protein
MIYGGHEIPFHRAYSEIRPYFPAPIIKAIGESQLIELIPTSLHTVLPSDEAARTSNDFPLTIKQPSY